jgi:hypothetical protein
MPARINPDTGHGYSFLDKTGKRKGRLIFRKFIGTNHNRHSLWEAECDCGAIVKVTTATKARSCGCLRREVAAATQRAKALTPDERRERLIANRKRQRELRRTDPVKAMQARLSRLHRFALDRVGGIKTSPTFVKLGYTVDEFVTHLERQFLPGMGWHNMAEWQIDHIIPVSEAKTEADVVALNQLPNLRPMWAGDNNAKKAKRTTLL